MKNCCLILLILKPEFHLNNIKNSVPNAQETDCVLNAQTEQLILFREVISFFWKSWKTSTCAIRKMKILHFKAGDVLCFEGLMCTVWKIYYWT